MTWFRVFASRVQALFSSQRLDVDLEDELRSHIEMETEANIRRGMTPAEARRVALVEFGGVTQTAEAYREGRGLAWVETVIQDIRFALRNFRKSPGFTSVAIASLALGMGVNTAIFSMVNMLLLRPLPVQDPEQLIRLSIQQKGGLPLPLFSYPDYREISEQTTGAFSGILAYQTGLDGLSIDGRADRIITHYVTGNYFSLLGVKATLGRLILPSEGMVEGADPVLVLAYTFWASHFASDPNIIGKRVLINGRPVTVVGIGPKKFHGVQAMLDVQGYLPLSLGSISNAAVSGSFHNRSLPYLYVLSRLGPGVTLDQAETRLKVIAKRLAAAYPKALEGVSLQAAAERTGRVPDAAGLSSLSAVFLAMAALVLVLACVNLANLLMVRAMARQKEVAMRSSLGCSRGRLIRQFLTESLMLSFFGALAGLLVAAWTCSALSSLKLQGIPIYLDFSFDRRVFAYAFAAAAVTGLLLGLWPALRASRADLAKVTRESGRQLGVRRQRMRSALVMGQVAASFLLLIVAALLARSLENARRLDLGFDARNVINFGMDPHHIGYDEAQGRRFYRELLRRVRALPGVESAGLAVSGPMSAYPLPGQVRVEGDTSPHGQSAPTVFYDLVSQGFFETLRIPVVRGRLFVESDSQNAPRVGVINQSFAEHFWPGQDTIGKRFQFMTDPEHWIQVVGVLPNTRYLAVGELQRPYFFLPFEQNYASIETLRVRAHGSPDIVTAEVQKEIASLAPGLPVAGVETMLQQLNSSISYLGYRVQAGFAAALGFLALALALLGLYGTVSYSAAQRTHEIGIRIALGAQRRDIRRLVLGRGLLIVCIGVPAGLALSLAAAPIVRRLVTGVSATDPLTFAEVAMLMACVTLMACYIPARRAMRVDPTVALRNE